MAGKQQANTGGFLLLIIIFVGALAQCGDDTDRNSSSAEDFTSASNLIGTNPTDNFEREEPRGVTAQFDEGETAYTTADSLNGRASPSTDSAIVKTLPHSSSATVIDRSGDWMKLRAADEEFWVSSQYVSRYRPPPRPRYTPKPQQFYGSGCPCSGSQVCIGPRGGRYCITSGGNKRYGV